MTRRSFTVLSAAALAACVASPHNALPVVGKDLKVRTPDGEAEAHFVHPVAGKHPAVVFWTDVLGLRNVFRLMAARLAANGYAVLVANPYYRSISLKLAPDGSHFEDPVVDPELMARVKTITAENTAVDAVAFMAFLDAQPVVDINRKAGSAGYCIGGPEAIRTGAAVPHRIGCIASFHGYDLVTDKPDSPHLLIPKTQASLLICIADNDDAADPNARKVLYQTCAAAKRDCDIKVFRATKHGWCTPDSPGYNQSKAEKAWSRLLDRFSKALV